MCLDVCFVWMLCALCFFCCVFCLDTVCVVVFYFVVCMYVSLCLNLKTFQFTVIKTNNRRHLSNVFQEFLHEKGLKTLIS